MSAELVQFLSSHGTVLIITVALLLAVGIVQWRKARVAEMELTLKRDLLEQGMSIAEVETILRSGPPARKGLLEQFSALSGGAKTGLIVGFGLVILVTVSVICGTIQSNAFWAHVRQQQQTPATPQPPLTLTPERPTILLDEGGAGSCRVSLTNGYAVYELQMTAVIREQDHPESELRVTVAPATLPRAEDANGRRHCDVQFHAVRGVGRFTVEVSAADRYRRQAQTTFVVHVGKLPPEKKQ